MSYDADIHQRRWGVLLGLRERVAHERRRLSAECVAVRGLMPLLMKPRNGGHWSHDDKVLLKQHIRRMSMLSPYLVLLVMPGGLLALPVLAWWLDRRRRARVAA